MRYGRLDEGSQPMIMTALFLIRIATDIQSETSSGNIRQKRPAGQPISGCERFADVLNRGSERTKERP
jgi:hypothetical protein